MKVGVSPGRAQRIVVKKPNVGLKLLEPQFFLIILVTWWLRQSTAVEETLKFNERLKILISYLLNRHSFTTLKIDYDECTDSFFARNVDGVKLLLSVDGNMRSIKHIPIKICSLCNVTVKLEFFNDTREISQDSRIFRMN